jgi:hypothetical protein
LVDDRIPLRVSTTGNNNQTMRQLTIIKSQPCCTIQSFSNQKLTDCNSVAENSDGGDDRQQYLCGREREGITFLFKKKRLRHALLKIESLKSIIRCHHSRLKLGRTIQEMEPHFKHIKIFRLFLALLFFSNKREFNCSPVYVHVITSLFLPQQRTELKRR